MLQPLKDRVVIKMEESKEATQGGIILPDAAQKKPQRGTVIAIGKDVDELQVKDIVYVAEQSGVEVEVDGEKYVLMMEQNVLGYLKAE